MLGAIESTSQGFLSNGLTDIFVSKGLMDLSPLCHGP